ncbi:unnamed protein product [Meganyctiphanes norvegica]|uniref:CN hydrolase domain-containing protein n=1 Tax=Meganyctiphanes norvegica TaxID=48144 RepID=A0AAV2Q1P0_MEGNR
MSSLLRLLLGAPLVTLLLLLPLVAHVRTQHGHIHDHSHEEQEVTYRAAVLEYEAYSEWTEEGGMGIVRENAIIIAEYLAQAKALGVDIMVAPEYGIQGMEQHYSLFNNSNFRTLMQFLPDPAENVEPCALDMAPEHFEAIQILSCAAKANQAYLVVNLGELVPCSNHVYNPFNIAIDERRWCPPGGYHFYNTEIVLDRTGVVIVKYHKKNLFLEPAYTDGEQPDEAALFTTDFGITFSCQVCFDIAYYHPGVSNVDNHDIKDVVMSTSWLDMLPFHIADAVQNAWSRGLGVNLMVAGQHLPERAKVGSGIYRNFYDKSVNYTYDVDSGNKMIVSDVVSITSAPITLINKDHYTTKKDMLYSEVISLESKTKNSGRDHVIYWDDLSNYTHVVLEKGEGLYAQACHADGLCCDITYTLSSDLIYMLTAYSGTVEKGFGDYNIYTQICGLTWCASADDVNSCTHFESGLPEDDAIGPFAISGNTSCEKTYATVFHRDLLLVDNSLYDFGGNADNVYTIQTSEPTPNLMSAGLYGRWYSRDPQ